MMNDSTNDLSWLVERGLQSNSASVDITAKKSGFRKMWLGALAALLYAVAMGMACAYSATATDDMKKPSSTVIPTVEDISWIGSLVGLGALFGGAIAGYLSNKLGRKGTLLFTSLPFFGGWMFIAFATNVLLIFVGRFVTGVCVGLICATTPAYLVEISTPEVRGLLGSSFQLFVVIGVLLVNTLGSLMTWNWAAIASASSIVLALLAVCFVPESPRWLVSRGKYQEAIKAVEFFQGPAFDAAAECVAINEDLSLQPKGSLKFKELLQPGVYKPLLLSVGLVFFQQFTGSNSLLNYTVEIFRESNGPIDADYATILVDAVLVVATAVAGVLSDRAGRKILLLASGIGMLVTLAAFGGYQNALYHNQDLKQTYGWVPLMCVVIYIAAFSIGFGPIPWLMIAELSPVRFRSLIGGVATACCWGFVFIITKTFLTLVQEIHDFNTYWIYAGFCLLSCIFTVLCIPETKGRPFEEINEIFTAVNMRSKS